MSARTTLAGLVVLATRLRSLLPRAEGAGARPPWSLADGLGVLVRGDFWSRLYLVAVVQLESPIGGEALASSASTVALDWLYGWGTLFSSLPLAWLVWRHLLAPAARDRRRTG